MGLSLRRFAALVGVSPTAISKAVRAGRLTTLPDGTIDERSGLAEWRDVSQASERPGTAGATATGQQAAAARTMKAVLEARLLELELKKRSGELVSVATVEMRAFKVARKVRETLMTAASRIAPVVAGIADPTECFKVIEAEMERACDELSALPEREDANGD